MNRMPVADALAQVLQAPIRFHAYDGSTAGPADAAITAEVRSSKALAYMVSAPGEPDGTHNRLIEKLVDDLSGRKSLYSTSYYPEEDFWRLYNGPSYDVLKKSYDPDGRLLDLYAKCVQNR